jgi:glyoxylase-like metal-dependent hydrolase (beta-lactamase superfamily II)
VSLLIDRVIAPYYQTNCWVIAPASGSECVLVDPGIDIPNLNPAIKAKLNEHKLKVGAVIITHGHLDHTFSLISAIDDFVEVDCFVHEKDRDLLQYPERAMGPQSQALVKDLKNSSGATIEFREPHSTYSVNDGQKLKLGELNFEFLHTPGHTPGSLVSIVNEYAVISGDVLFKGAIGRTDFPRGSLRDMEQSLREKIATLPDDLRVLPGHGDETTIIHEKRNNRFLQAAMEWKLEGMVG